MATHRPIPHHEIVQVLIETPGFRHIGVVADEYAVSPDGMKMFGVLDLEMEMHGSAAPGHSRQPPWLPCHVRSSTHLARIDPRTHKTARNKEAAAELKAFLRWGIRDKAVTIPG